MTSVRESVLANGLPLVELGMEGTRVVSLFVALDAGARTERPEENGIAHFLEHLVFKGGERYRSQREITRTAERLGVELGAYTTQDLVAFFVTCRAGAVMDAADLLTDFVGCGRIDPDDLERERGVVVQEIAQSDDQVPREAAKALDRAAYGDHPLGRPVLGPAEHIESFSREAVLGFRERRWAPSAGSACVAGDLSGLDRDHLAQLLSRFPARSEPHPPDPAPAFARRVRVEERDTNQSHLRLHWRTSIKPGDPAQRAALTVYTTLLGGSMGSRLFDEIRDQRALCYSIWAYAVLHSDAAGLTVGAGLEPEQCLEAYARITEIVEEIARDGPRGEEVQRARTYAASRLVLALEGPLAVASRTAHRQVVFGDIGLPEETIAALDAVTESDVGDVARGISGTPAVACVGPHTAADFGSPHQPPG